MQKLVDAGAPLVDLLVIHPLEDFTSSCTKLFEILRLSDSSTRFSVRKRINFEKFGKS